MPQNLYLAVGKILSCFGLMLASFTLLTAPTHAGQYVASYSGTLTVDGVSQTVNSYDTYSYHGGCQNTATLSITGTLTWQSWYPGDNPPSKTNVLEIGNAAGSGSGPVGAEMTPSNGLGDPVDTNSAPITDGNGITIGTTFAANCNGSHIRSGYSGATIALPACTMTNTYGGGGNGGSGFFYSVGKDDRGITLHRDGAVGETVDADGTTHGDTIYSYNSTVISEYPEGEDTVPHLIWQYFHPQFAGGWTPSQGGGSQGSGLPPYDINWTWSPNESEDTWNLGKCSMPFGSINYNVNGDTTGSPTGVQDYSVTYTATDNTTSVSASATYKLKVHDVWENKRDDTPATSANQKRTYAQADGHIAGVSNNSGVKFTTPPTWSLQITASATLGFKFTPTFEPSWAKTLGIETNFAATVGGTFSITVPGPLLDPGYAAYPLVLTTWNTKNYLVDHYATAGFDSTCPEAADDPNSVTNTASWSSEYPIGTYPPG